jgi:hypothetical protein
MLDDVAWREISELGSSTFLPLTSLINPHSLCRSPSIQRDAESAGTTKQKSSPSDGVQLQAALELLRQLCVDASTQQHRQRCMNTTVSQMLPEHSTYASPRMSLDVGASSSMT